jgi:hypothetical protein
MKLGNLFSKIKIQITCLTTFLYIFLNMYEASFLTQNKSVGRIKTEWINNPHMTAYYNILRRVTEDAKRHHYCRLIAKLNNQIKTNLNIIKQEAGKLHLTPQTSLLNDGKEKDPELTVIPSMLFSWNLLEI